MKRIGLHKAWNDYNKEVYNHRKHTPFMWFQAGFQAGFKNTRFRTIIIFHAVVNIILIVALIIFVLT